MRIINTGRMTNDKAQMTNAVTLILLIMTLISGCGLKNNLQLAKDYALESSKYYKQAETKYQELIAQGKDLTLLNYELGKLYYEHGDFDKAVGALKQANINDAAKILAISYYRLGKFTDALEVFNKHELADSEYLYYWGLTCEKLNLFDKALAQYRKIKQDDLGFARLGAERINAIEKQATGKNILEIDPEAARIISNAPSEEAYPQAGALILSCDEKIVVTQDAKQVSYLHYLIKILNERGKEGFSETQISYDSTFEKIELEFARTIKPDGTVADVGSRHIRDVTKYLNFPLYSNARVYIISFPEIAEGSVIEYKVKITDNHLINGKDFVLNYPLQTQEPVISANFSLTFPKATPVHLKFLNEAYNTFGAALKPQEEENDGSLTYHWQFKDIPQIIPEANMPPGVEVNPTILISTFKSWEDIYKWWHGLAKDKIKTDPSIKDKLKELTSGLTEKEEIARAIYNFCAQEIRYVAVEYGQAGYEPHDAGDIFKNKYGDCKDQAILLVSMLREAGIEAWPVLIPTKEDYNLNVDFPSMLFNHCIAALSLNGKIKFLDPTAETCSFSDLRPDDQGRRVLVIKEDSYSIQEIPTFPAEHNMIKQALKLKVNNDETVSGSKENLTFGMYDQAQRNWLLYTQPELVEATLKEKIQEISIGAKLLRYKIKNLEDLNIPVVLAYDFQGPEYFTISGDLRIMPQLAVLDTYIVAKDKRNYPLDFSFLDKKESSFEIELPDKISVKYIPQGLSEDNPWMKFSTEYIQKDKKIIFNQRLELKKTMVSESEYAGFKEIFEKLAKQIKQRIVLERLR